MRKRCFLAEALLASWLSSTFCFGAPPQVTSTIPADGARDVCPDAPLRLTFNEAPSLGTNGTISIYSAAGGVADSIDLSQSVRGAQPRFIGGAVFTNYPVIISGNQATIFPHAKKVYYGQEFRVVVRPGVFANVTNEISWWFQTKDAGPRADATNLTVAADGSGDFCTVQGAVDWIPSGNTIPRRIFIKNGVYQEIIYVTNKPHLTFAGEDHRKTVIEYANNDVFNAKGLRKNQYRQTLGVDADDFAIRNLTVRNTTPKGGSQAEALRVDGKGCMVDDVDFYSFQDTVQLTGQVFVNNSYIEGDVDFIWGYGTCFFTNCEIKCLNSKAYVTQIRNDQNHFGAVFVDCRLTKAPGVSSAVLSRIEPARFPYSQVAWINCRMDDHIAPAAWLLTPATNSPATLRFWEYRTTDLTGTNLVDVRRRLPVSLQLTAEQAAQMRDAHYVFGDWAPSE
jgi:pectin methylesterase-like acyl-CoA thioesterase